MKIVREPMTSKRLKELLDYDEYTGVFTWKEDGRQRVKGDEAGRTGAGGFLYICVDGKSYPAHRLAWLWYYGAPVPKIVKHINGNPEDNYINNLTARGACDW